MIYLASQGNFVNAYLGEQEAEGQVLKHRNWLKEKDLTFLYFLFYLFITVPFQEFITEIGV